MRMKLIALSAMLVLAGCASQSAAPTLQLQQNYLAICESYTAVLKLATVANQAKKLTVAQQSAITQTDAVISPICSGPTPTDLNATITQITAAITTVAINSATAAQ